MVVHEVYHYALFKDTPSAIKTVARSDFMGEKMGMEKYHDC